jgi:putative addiction module component (TIGR02574 family)
MDKQATLDIMDSWPVTERVEFLFEAWGRLIRSGWQPDLSAEQKAVFDRRLDALDANPSDSVSWEAVEQHVKRTR